jgi:LPXTG-motif cell wall-anchored protein
MKKLLAVAALLFSLVLISDTVPALAQNSGGGAAGGGTAGGGWARGQGRRGRGGFGARGRFRRGGANIGATANASNGGTSLSGQVTAAQVAQATASNDAPVDLSAPPTDDATTTSSFDSTTTSTVGTSGARGRSRRGGLPNTGGDPWLLSLSGLLVTAAALGLRKRYC